MQRVLIGALVGGVALFVWQYAAWMFLDVHKLDVNPKLKHEDAVVAALKGEVRGVYWIPGGDQADRDPEGEAYMAWEQKHKAGPRGFLVFDPEGGEPMSVQTMGIGAACNILVALIAALMLAGASIRSFFGRFFLVVGIGLIVVLVQDVPNWNWQNFPDDWTRGAIIDHLAGMAIVGFLLALIVRPKSVVGGLN